MNDPVARLLLAGKAATMREAEELYLDSCLLRESSTFAKKRPFGRGAGTAPAHGHAAVSWQPRLGGFARLNAEERLASIVVALESVGLACLVMGGHAVRYYGLQRHTNDFDLTLAPDGWTDLAERLARTGLFPASGPVEGNSWRPGAFRRFVVGTLPDGQEEWVEFWRENHLLAPFPELLALGVEIGTCSCQTVSFLSLSDPHARKETVRAKDWDDITYLEEFRDARLHAQVVAADDASSKPAARPAPASSPGFRRTSPRRDSTTATACAPCSGEIPIRSPRRFLLPFAPGRSCPGLSRGDGTAGRALASASLRQRRLCTDHWSRSSAGSTSLRPRQRLTRPTRRPVRYACRLKPTWASPPHGVAGPGWQRKDCGGWSKSTMSHRCRPRHPVLSRRRQASIAAIPASAQQTPSRIICIVSRNCSRWSAKQPTSVSARAVSAICAAKRGPIVFPPLRVVPRQNAGRGLAVKPAPVCRATPGVFRGLQVSDVVITPSAHSPCGPRRSDSVFPASPFATLLSRPETVRACPLTRLLNDLLARLAPRFPGAFDLLPARRQVRLPRSCLGTPWGAERSVQPETGRRRYLAIGAQLVETLCLDVFTDIPGVDRERRLASPRRVVQIVQMISCIRRV